MARVDASEEWLRLTRLYQQMSDEELVRLRDDFDGLTPIAQDVIRPILQTRGLWHAAQIPEAPSIPTRHADYSFLRASQDPQALNTDTVDRDSLLMDTGVAVRACDSLEDARLFGDLLEANKVPSVVITTKRGYPVRFPEIMVFPEDVDRAPELLTAADLESLRRAVAENETGPGIEGSSNCPSCGSTEIMLQPASQDCLNTWLCAECGRSWQDNLPTDWTTDS